MSSGDNKPQRVIGIGASAGGLDGFLCLFSSLPVMADTAVVIAQHMARDEHAELVLNLLNREGLWPATIPKTGTLLESGKLYLLPAEQDGIVEEGRIILKTPSDDSYSSPSVNRLFRSLAADGGHNTLAVILSGAGSDGALGCRAIKQSGGKVWIQSPDEASYNSMPQAAADAVKADFVGTVAEIAHEIRQFAFPNPHSDASPTLPHELNKAISKDQLLPKDGFASLAGSVLANRNKLDELDKVTELIFEHTGIDFAGYKRETLLRRLEKRKSQLFSSPDTDEDYPEYLQQHPSELEILEQYLLVSVSSFFRDADVFQYLRPVISELVAEKRKLMAAGKDDGVFRILVAGCATGEEAYSLAILCRQLDLPFPVEVTAVDLNREAVHIAEKGLYPAKKLTELPDDLLHRYFHEVGDGYQVKSQLREKIHFIQGDIFAEKSDHNFDLVSCRNLMIYLKREQQDELVENFYQQMNANSALVIGLTENLSPSGQKLFSTTDYFHRIFKRRTS